MRKTSLLTRERDEDLHRRVEKRLDKDFQEYLKLGLCEEKKMIEFLYTFETKQGREVN